METCAAKDLPEKWYLVQHYDWRTLSALGPFSTRSLAVAAAADRADWRFAVVNATYERHAPCILYSGFLDKLLGRGVSIGATPLEHTLVCGFRAQNIITNHDRVAILWDVEHAK